MRCNLVLEISRGEENNLLVSQPSYIGLPLSVSKSIKCFVCQAFSSLYALIPLGRISNKAQNSVYRLV